MFKCWEREDLQSGSEAWPKYSRDWDNYENRFDRESGLGEVECWMGLIKVEAISYPGNCVQLEWCRRLVLVFGAFAFTSAISYVVRVKDYYLLY